MHRKKILWVESSLPRCSASSQEPIIATAAQGRSRPCRDFNYSLFLSDKRWFSDVGRCDSAR